MPLPTVECDAAPYFILFKVKLLFEIEKLSISPHATTKYSKKSSSTHPSKVNGDQWNIEFSLTSLQSRCNIIIIKGFQMNVVSSWDVKTFFMKICRIVPETVIFSLSNAIISFPGEFLFSHFSSSFGFFEWYILVVLSLDWKWTHFRWEIPQHQFGSKKVETAFEMRKRPKCDLKER